VADVLTDGAVVFVADFWVLDVWASDEDHTTKQIFIHLLVSDGVVVSEADFSALGV
jgi:hypothetical protein